MPKFIKSMSRIGKKAIEIPQGVEVSVENGQFIVKGRLGEMKRDYPARMLSVKVEDNKVFVSPVSKTEQTGVFWGTFRSHFNNMIQGVSKGWQKSLELVGVGYRAEVQGNDLVLTVGYSHPVKVTAPEGITFKVEKSIITVSGANKESVGDVSDKVRSIRPPEPYKGKGIKYIDEEVRRKAGKAAKTQTA